MKRLRTVRKALLVFWSSRFGGLLLSGGLAAAAAVSITVWWQNGYWPISWSEWQYRRLVARQDLMLREVNGLWRRADLQAPTSQQAWEGWQRRVDQRVLPLRADYERFLAANPFHDRAMTAYGAFLEDVGREDEALIWWGRAMQLTRRNPELLNNLANYYGHDGHPLLAIQLYEAAIRLRSDEAVYHFNLANMYCLFRHESTQLHGWDLPTIFSKSLEQFRLARECDRGNFEYAAAYAETFYGANFLLHNQPWHEAMAAWEHCLAMELEPEQRDFVRVHVIRISTYLKDPMKAIRCFSEIQSDSQRRLAGRLLRKAFPDSFTESCQI